MPVQPANISKEKTSCRTEDPHRQASLVEAQKSFATGEETIRLAVSKWFGPLVVSDSSARPGKNEHHESILETLLRLHAVSCSLVSAEQRLPLSEQDVLATIQILNYVETSLHCPPRVIASRCAIRSLREQDLRANQLDPLQLRHLLAFHPDVRTAGRKNCDFEALKLACDNNDRPAIHEWFKLIARTKGVLPTDTPQLLRRMAVDLWSEGCRDFFETFVTELAVLDATMFDIHGWENTRQFFAIFKRVHGSACHFAASFLKSEDVALAIALYRQLGDSAQTAHFEEIARGYDAPAFRHFESAILAAAKERSSRDFFETNSASPFSTHRSTGMARENGFQIGGDDALFDQV